MKTHFTQSECFKVCYGYDVSYMVVKHHETTFNLYMPQENLETFCKIVSLINHNLKVSITT